MDEATRRRLQRGREQYAAGELDAAERSLAPLARDRAPFADVYGMLGVIEFRRGRFDRAREMLEEALKLNPAYAEAAMNLTVTYNELGLYDQAKAVYKKMMASRRGGPAAGLSELDPFVKGKLANMHAEVGDAYLEAGLPVPAGMEYEKALGLCPSYVDIRMKLGGALRAAGNHAAAIREYERVKRERPGWAPARLQLGMTLYATKKTAEAAREWQSVLELDPDNKFARMYLGLVARGAGGGEGSGRGR
jgi:tetratricopeptide (TPR) repeat protein